MNIKIASMPTYNLRAFLEPLKKKPDPSDTHINTRRVHSLNESTHGNLGHKDKSL